MREQDRTSIENTAQQILEMVIAGDVDQLRPIIAPSQQVHADGMLAAVSDNHPALAHSRAQFRGSFLLDAPNGGNADGLFYCGIWGAKGMPPDGAEFDLPGTPAGTYAVVFEDAIGDHGPYSVTEILQDAGGWKVAGLYIFPQRAAGHDGAWYLNKARDYRAKGQNYNAWFCYLAAWQLSARARFMTNPFLENITKESRQIMPRDVLATVDKPLSYSADGKIYQLTAIEIDAVENSFDLSITYSLNGTTDQRTTTADSRKLANAYVSQHPELKELFDGAWVRAIGSAGHPVQSFVPLK